VEEVKVKVEQLKPVKIEPEIKKEPGIKVEDQVKVESEIKEEPGIKKEIKQEFLGMKTEEGIKTESKIKNEPKTEIKQEIDEIRAPLLRQKFGSSELVDINQKFIEKSF
jgi:hypothetical protein